MGEGSTRFWKLVEWKIESGGIGFVLMAMGTREGSFTRRRARDANDRNWLRKGRLKAPAMEVEGWNSLE